VSGSSRAMPAGEHRKAYGGRRMSAQRGALARAAVALGCAFTVDELAAAARSEASAPGTATAYRAVAAMVEAGFLEQVGERGGSALFARCEVDGHHHHLVCTSCGALAQAPCPLDERTLATAADGGFTVTGHDVAIYGLCRDCGLARRGAA
jgi:Fur family ferric uptake transcriptional regulator